MTNVPRQLLESHSCAHPWLQIGYTPSFERNCYSLPVAGLAPSVVGARIVHLSDMHLTRRWSIGYDALIQTLRDAPPDLILISGDLVDHKLDHRSALPTLERFVSQLASRCGIFGVLGNHDGDLLAPRLAGMGIQWIEHKLVRVPVRDGIVELIGLPGVKRYDFDADFVGGVRDRAHGSARIIVAHYPDQVRFVAPLRADAMLAGHTHAGQICFPNDYALLTHDKLPHRMARGVHRFGETLLFVNRGFGTTRWPIRIFAPAEVIELRLSS